MKQTIISCLLLMAIACTQFAASAAAESGETPQSLYLKAGRLERQGELNLAKQHYEALIDQYPASEFAVKANDRLLELMKSTRTTIDTNTPSATPAQPQPAVPHKRRALELARLYNKAVYLRDDEFNRHYYAFQAKYGHRFNRAELTKSQEEWHKAADMKVRQELGMGINEIKQKLEEACQELGIKESCNENSLK